jgi:hypothetical protein
MIGKLFIIVRDLFLFCTLIALLQIALEHNVSFITEHKKSLIHELDRDFIDQLYTAQRHLHTIEEHPVYGITHKITIADLKKELATIEEHYKKNSLGLAFLGPIGTASIVIKEEKLNKKLLTAVNDITALLHTASAPTTPFEPAQTINNGLAANKPLLKTIVA